MDLAAARKIFEVNALAALSWTQQAYRGWMADNGGAVVNVSSVAGIKPAPGIGFYGASKAMLTHITQELAVELGPRIRVNAVAPGPIWTPFWTKPGGFAETMGKFHKMEPQAAVEHEMKLRQLPLARLGTPEEVANVIVFLASDRASFVTSAVWGVDGGSIRNIA